MLRANHQLTSRYPRRGKRAREPLPPELPEPEPAPTNGARLVCLRPLLFKADGRYCVQFRGQVVSRHCSFALALYVRRRVEARLFRAQVLAIVPSYVTRAACRGALVKDPRV
jgi:hypothetical protein